MKTKICIVFGLVFFSYNLHCWGQHEERLWRRIVKSPEEEVIKKYVSNYPNGKFYDKMETWLWGGCLANQNKEMCRIFVRVFPESAHTLTAMEIMNKMATNPVIVHEPITVSTNNASLSNPKDPFGSVSMENVEFFEIDFKVSSDITSINITNQGKVKLTLNADSVMEGRYKLKKGKYELSISKTDGSTCKTSFEVEGPMLINEVCEE